MAAQREVELGPEAGRLAELVNSQCDWKRSSRNSVNLPKKAMTWGLSLVTSITKYSPYLLVQFLSFFFNSEQSSYDQTHVCWGNFSFNEASTADFSGICLQCYEVSFTLCH